MLNREQILGSFARSFATVQTEIGEVRIRNLTERECCDLNRGVLTADGKPNPNFPAIHRRRVVAATVVDSNGELLLDPVADLDRLREISGGVVQAIYHAAIKHCGLSADEDAEKNSGATTDCDSPGD